MAGAHIAIHHAKKRRLHEQREEEHLIAYSNRELAQDYEFKILRSYVTGFNSQQRLDAILAAEARAGWELVEKLDRNRVRLRRPAAAATRDTQLPRGQDPYRTRYGAGPWVQQASLALGLFGLMAAGALLLWIISPLF